MIVFGILGLCFVLGAIWHEIQVWRGKRPPGNQGHGFHGNPGQR